MAATIVATAGSATANSFVTEAEMTAYCDARLNAAIWTADEAQVAALIEATRDINLMVFKGTRVTRVQALAWPRDWAINPDQPEVEYIGNIELMYFPNNAVPQRVKDATCELALQYLKQGGTDLAVADPNAGVIESTVDVLTTRWASPQSKPEGLGRFPRVLQYLGPLLENGGGGMSLLRS
jgi:hypothetical protein